MTLKPPKIGLVVFDWAGTMVDFGCRAPVAALRRAFARRGVVLEDATLRADMGRAKADHIAALLRREEALAQWRAARGAQPTAEDARGLVLDLSELMRTEAAAAADLIPGALKTVTALRARGVKIASSTGYTREMMEPVLRRAADQGYVPDHVLCAGETPEGRPSPLMIYRACADLGVWPLDRVVKVDDTDVGVREGRAAGAFTVGLSASGNGIGLSIAEFQALDPRERRRRTDEVAARLRAAGADVVIETVADLPAALEERGLL